MKKHTLLRTNLIVCTIITVGFIITSLISYRSNLNIYAQEVEHVSALATGSVYSQIDRILSEPLDVSRTMASDSLLIERLAQEQDNLENDDYTADLRQYLDTYRQKYGYDSTFLVSVATGRYYHFDGINRVLAPGNPENNWYYDFLASEAEYALNIDNDEVKDNRITVFINCKLYGENGETAGVIGVGITVDTVQAILREYDEEYDIAALLVDSSGTLQLSSEQCSYHSIGEDNPETEKFSQVALTPGVGQQSFWNDAGGERVYIVAQYIENLQWYLIVEKDMTLMSRALHVRFIEDVCVVTLITVLVLVTISFTIKRYQDQLLAHSSFQKEEYQRLLNQATAGLYESLLEIDVTHNRVCGESGKQYLKTLGVSADTTYEEMLHINSRRIQADYADGYLNTFMPERITACYHMGINNLSYDFPMHQGDDVYHWMRVIVRIFYWSSDASIRIISYRKNIDAEKRREMLLLEQSQRDSLTGLYNKGVTEKSIIGILRAPESADKTHALLILDIDDFKNVNTTYGHAFGDTVIHEFAAELKSSFREIDIVGRIGGDEFAVLVVNCSSIAMLKKKLERLCARIAHKDFGQEAKVACSIGVALYPTHGTTYTELYEKADHALYHTKQQGKNNFSIVQE